MIWTGIADFNYSDDNRYAKSASFPYMLALHETIIIHCVA